jgi:hypothetical protein
MRQLVFDFEYVTEAYLARVCETTEAWDDEEERTPSRLPAVSGESSASAGRGSSGSDEA